MQVISHASNAILNHPFIHLVALRGNRGLSRSRLFLQQTVDQALFHCGWVFRLVQTCEVVGFEVYNPLVGHLVAATATISWLFQFSRDQRTAKRVNEDLARCERFLANMSNTWLHISQKVRIPALDPQSIAENFFV